MLVIINGAIVCSLPSGDIVGFSPPLVINRLQIDELVEATLQAVEKYEQLTHFFPNL